MEWRLSRYEKSVSAPIVLNTAQLQSKVYIMIPSPEFYTVTLIGLSEIVNGSEVPVDYEEHLYRDGGRPWLIADSEIFNVTAGQHMYRFKFIDNRINAETDLYLTYIIQDDNPDKPYIYMNRED